MAMTAPIGEVPLGPEPPRSVRSPVRSVPLITARELEVLLAVVRDGPVRGALRLGISYQTVKNHLAVLHQRTGAQSRANLVWLLWPVYGDQFAALDLHRRNSHNRRTVTW